MPGPSDPRSLASPPMIRAFAYALGRHLPRRLQQAKMIGRDIRAISSNRPKR